jgi:hypothetical protein
MHITKQTLKSEILTADATVSPGDAIETRSVKELKLNHKEIYVW